MAEPGPLLTTAPFKLETGAPVYKFQISLDGLGTSRTYRLVTATKDGQDITATMTGIVGTNNAINIDELRRRFPPDTADAILRAIGTLAFSPNSTITIEGRLISSKNFYGSVKGSNRSNTEVFKENTGIKKTQIYYFSDLFRAGQDLALEERTPVNIEKKILAKFEEYVRIFFELGEDDSRVSMIANILYRLRNAEKGGIFNSVLDDNTLTVDGKDYDLKTGAEKFTEARLTEIATALGVTRAANSTTIAVSEGANTGNISIEVGKTSDLSKLTLAKRDEIKRKLQEKLGDSFVVSLSDAGELKIELKPPERAPAINLEQWNTLVATYNLHNGSFIPFVDLERLLNDSAFRQDSSIELKLIGRPNILAGQRIGITIYPPANVGSQPITLRTSTFDHNAFVRIANQPWAVSLKPLLSASSAESTSIVTTLLQNGFGLRANFKDGQISSVAPVIPKELQSISINLTGDQQKKLQAIVQGSMSDGTPSPTAIVSRLRELENVNITFQLGSKTIPISYNLGLLSGLVSGSTSSITQEQQDLFLRIIMNLVDGSNSGVKILFNNAVPNNVEAIPKPT